jgi:hypothetical protein
MSTYPLCQRNDNLNNAFDFPRQINSPLSHNPAAHSPQFENILS